MRPSWSLFYYTFSYTAGGALLQKGVNDGIWRPVAYYLKKHIPAKSNYKIHNKELLVIMRYLKV